MEASPFEAPLHMGIGATTKSRLTKKLEIAVLLDDGQL